MKRKFGILTCALLIIVMTSISVFGVTKTSDEVDLDSFAGEMELIPYDLSTEDSEILIIDADENPNAAAAAVARSNDGYMGTQWVRGKNIGTIFNWTSASEVKRNNGFSISANFTAKVFGINMQLKGAWNTSMSYKWKKGSKYSQMKVYGQGDIQIKKYMNKRTGIAYFIKSTHNQEDKKLQR